MHLRHLSAAAAFLIASAAAAPAAAATVVPVPHFESIELNGGGTIVLRRGPVQRVTIRNGSTEFTDVRVTGRGSRRIGRSTVLNSDSRLVIDACNRRCPTRYDLEIEIVTPDVGAVAINGGGEIVVQPGFAQQRTVAAAVNGGGEIDLRALPVRDVAAAVNGGGRLLVRAQESLAAAVHGGGEIRYWGDPDVSTSIQGGGVVRRGTER